MKAPVPAVLRRARLVPGASMQIVPHPPPKGHTSRHHGNPPEARAGRSSNPRSHLSERLPGRGNQLTFDFGFPPFRNQDFRHLTTAALVLSCDVNVAAQTAFHGGKRTEQEQAFLIVARLEGAANLAVWEGWRKGRQQLAAKKGKRNSFVWTHLSFEQPATL